MPVAPPFWLHANPTDLHDSQYTPYIYLHTSLSDPHNLILSTNKHTAYLAHTIAYGQSVCFYATEEHKKFLSTGSMTFLHQKATLASSIRISFGTQTFFHKLIFHKSSLFAQAHHLLLPCLTLTFFATMPSPPSPRRGRSLQMESTPLLLLSPLTVLQSWARSSPTRFTLPPLTSTAYSPSSPRLLPSSSSTKVQ